MKTNRNNHEMLITKLMIPTNPSDPTRGGVPHRPAPRQPHVPAGPRGWHQGGTAGLWAAEGADAQRARALCAAGGGHGIQVGAHPLKSNRSRARYEQEKNEKRLRG